MASPITPQEYIAWVQRSLNRLLGSTLATNGDDTAEYRAKVREFKSMFGLGSSAEVGAREQNALIKANHSRPEYVRWAQTALDRAVGGGSGSAPTGIMDSATKAALRSFQAYEGLNDDGWIGARTETVLIQRSTTFPPGHTARPPKEPPKPEEIPISLKVSGHVPHLVQKGVTCWAAAFAMMQGWKRGTKNIRQTLDGAGQWWRNRYDRGLFLSEPHTATLAGILGLKGEREVPENWAAKLADHGPLMIAQDPGVPGWIHWIVVVGWRKTLVFPDRSLDRYELQYNEPFSGASPFIGLGSLVDKANDLQVSHYRVFHY
jgi:putative peptidoglycan binding protein/papain like cysteine protease AvrRpt2